MHRMRTGNSPGQPQPVTKELKRLLLTFVGLMVALDATIIGVYYALHVESRPLRVQQTFVAVWVVLTLVVVTTMLKRIRVARRRR
jgi:lysylphosphatidylglycerol synthetase-like protein (DUF2156 family)